MGGEVKHVPLAGTCDQVVTTPEATSRGVEATPGPMGEVGSTVTATDALAEAEGEG
jgi:hypothetical protein